MSRICTVCGKGPVAGRKYKRRGMERRKGGAGSKITGKTKRMIHPNLQSIRVLVKKGTVKRCLVCTSCIQAEKITKG